MSMGNRFSNKHSPSKKDKHLEAPDADVEEVTQKDAKSGSNKDEGSSVKRSESFGSAIRRSFRKRNPFRKKSSHHKEKNGSAVEEETNGTFNQPKIVITSPSDAEASIESDSPKKKITVSPEPTGGLRDAGGEPQDACGSAVEDGVTDDSVASLEKRDQHDDESRANDTELETASECLAESLELENDSMTLDLTIDIMDAMPIGVRSDRLLSKEDDDTVVAADAATESSEALLSSSDVVIDSTRGPVRVEESYAEPEEKSADVEYVHSPQEESFEKDTETIAEIESTPQEQDESELTKDAVVADAPQEEESHVRDDIVHEQTAVLTDEQVRQACFVR